MFWTSIFRHYSRGQSYACRCRQWPQSIFRCNDKDRILYEQQGSLPEKLLAFSGRFHPVASTLLKESSFICLFVDHGDDVEEIVFYCSKQMKAYFRADYSELL